MLTPCNGENGCGTVLRQNQQNVQRTDLFNTPSTMTAPSSISFPQMTDITGQLPQAQVPGTTSVPTGTGMIASTFPMPGTETIPGQPDLPMAADVNVNVNDDGSSSVIPESVLPESPQFAVPNNPLLPPGYQEILNYENLQYLNGFLRTQIGKYVRVEQLIGSSTLEDRYGYLIGVGINYIVLQELGTGNVSALDYYNIKYVYVYFSAPQLPTSRR